MTSLKIGDKAPEFAIPNQDGEIVKRTDFEGEKLVIYFYPKDNTPTCTTQSCNLRDNYNMLLEKGYKVLGVSADTQKKHQNFIKKFKLPFPLLADTEKEMLKAYGVWGKKKTFGKVYEGIHRTTFVIDESGNIIDIITKVKAKMHVQQVLG